MGPARQVDARARQLATVMRFFYMQNTCSVHGPFFPEYQGDRCPICTQRSVEVLLARYERLLSAGNFAEVDRLLKVFPVDTASPLALVTITSITFHGKDQLHERTDFLARTEARLRGTLGDERAEKLLEHRR